MWTRPHTRPPLPPCSQYWDWDWLVLRPVRDDSDVRVWNVVVRARDFSRECVCAAVRHLLAESRSLAPQKMTTTLKR